MMVPRRTSAPPSGCTIVPRSTSSPPSGWMIRPRRTSAPPSAGRGTTPVTTEASGKMQRPAKPKHGSDPDPAPLEVPDAGGGGGGAPEVPPPGEPLVAPLPVAPLVAVPLPAPLAEPVDSEPLWPSGALRMPLLSVAPPHDASGNATPAPAPAAMARRSRVGRAGDFR